MFTFKLKKYINHRHLLNSPLIKGVFALLTGLSMANVYAVVCDPSDANTPEKISACITKDDLINHLVDLQNISDNNIDHTFDLFPGGPHGSRDPGTPGDIASVEYYKSVFEDAGYKVAIQEYPVLYSVDATIPVFEQVSPVAQLFEPGEDFSTPVYAPSGEVTAPIQAVKGVIDAPSTTGSSAGCSASDFDAADFTGKIALMERGGCANRVKVINAIAAGAVGTITMNTGDINVGNTLISADGMTVPIVAYIKRSVGLDLYHQSLQGETVVHLKADTINEERTTYNIIADSRWGDPNNTVLLVSHYDSIFGAGMSDNTAGCVSLLAIAKAMKDTPTLNHVRFLLTGAEELGLYGVYHYIDSIKGKTNRIGFVLDSDNASTNNFFISIAGLADESGGAAWYKGLFGQQVYNKVQLGVNMLVDSLTRQGIPITYKFAEDSTGSTGCGTDGCAFGDIGIPWSNIFAGQGTFLGGKTQEQVELYQPVVDQMLAENPASHVQNFVGPSDVCMDVPYVFCDNLDNVNYELMLPITRAYAEAAIQLAFIKNLNSRSQKAQDIDNYKPKHENWYTRRNVVE